MNGLEEQLAKVLEKALNVAEQTGNFVMENAPQLLQEFYRWHTWLAILGIILGLVIMTVIHLIIRRVYKSDEDPFIYIFEIFQIIPLVFLGANIYNLVFITTAPKLYLIEYFI